MRATAIRRILYILVSLTALGPLHVNAAPHAYLGETFTCRFPKVGTVVIDTREPGSSITVNGKRYPARGGSDFYVDDQSGTMVMFEPKMRRWSWQDTFNEVACTSRRNSR